MTSRRARPVRRLVTLTAALAVVVTTASTAASEQGSAQRVRDLSGHRWHYRAQVDGARGVDRVVIVGGKHLRLGQFQPGQGDGHVTVQVHLAGSGRTLSARRFLTYTSVRKPWTPWLGATDLDHRSGQEILIGFSTGTEQSFTALTDRGGRLVRLSSPFGTTWSVGEVSFNDYGGWKCTGNGVERRSVSPTSASNKHYRIVHDRYAYRAGAWVRTRHGVRTVAATSSGQPPAYTGKFVRFACSGLPKKVF